MTGILLEMGETAEIARRFLEKQYLAYLREISKVLLLHAIILQPRWCKYPMIIIIIIIAIIL